MSDVTTQLLVQAAAYPLTGTAQDYDPLLATIGDARYVLLGEAAHGTHEFYRERALITQRLIAERGFTAVAVEADWPDAYRVNRYVRGVGNDEDSRAALDDFKRFPQWMWRNRDVVDFIDWLRDYNDGLGQYAQKIGFYGLDLYSLFGSIEAVLGYLDKYDPEAARRARFRYSCFDHYGDDSQAYGYAASFDLSRSCEDEAVAQLKELQRQAEKLASQDGRVAADEYFFAEQNARLVRNAEEYYRMMFRGRVSSWNLRDQHMAETLHALASHIEAQRQPAKIVVWAHNSHLGDARATEMGERGEWNVGQLARTRYGRQARLVGFSTYRGMVTAATDWGGEAERKRVRPALSHSYEELLHKVGLPCFMVVTGENEKLAASLRTQRLERAIGVIYRPESERLSHYFHAHLTDQFDAVLHFDETTAVEPLERTSQWETGEVPETFPFGV
jgi:erythromycin esterase-like protein